MKRLIKTLVILICALVAAGEPLIAQQGLNTGEGNLMKGIFKGIGPGNLRQKGAKQPLNVWMIEDESGEKLSFPILVPDASVKKVIASPKSYIGKRCSIVWTQSEEMLAGINEVVDINHIVSVSWSDTEPPSGSLGGGSPLPPAATPEMVVRAFFAAIQYKELEAISALLNDPVSYYQSKPGPKSAALADIKSDWKKYTNWIGEVLNVEPQGPTACTFQLNYSMLEGEKPRSGSLQCSVTVNPNARGRITSISAKPIRSAAAQTATPAANASSARKFRYTRPETPDIRGAVFEIDATLGPTSVQGIWKTSFLPAEPDEKPVISEFSGQVTGTTKSGEKRFSISFKGDVPYLFPVNQKPYWLIKDGPKGTSIRVTAFEVVGRNSEQVTWDLREVQSR